MLLAFLLAASTIQSIAVEARLRHHRNAQLVDPVNALVALEAATSTLPDSTTSTLPISTITQDAGSTVTSITSYVSTLSTSSSTCTPKSICVDGITCSMRYGGCYDKNYCNGNTSPYPIPTCDSSPANGLSANNIGVARQRLGENDIAGEVIVKSLVNAKAGEH